MYTFKTFIPESRVYHRNFKSMLGKMPSKASIYRYRAEKFLERGSHGKSGMSLWQAPQAPAPCVSSIHYFTSPGAPGLVGPLAGSTGADGTLATLLAQMRHPCSTCPPSRPQGSRFPFLGLAPWETSLHSEWPFRLGTWVECSRGVWHPRNRALTFPEVTEV